MLFRYAMVCISLAAVYSGQNLYTINKLIISDYVLSNSIALVKFSNRPETEQYVVVGTVKDLVQGGPRSHAGGCLYVYKLSPAGDVIELVHRTPVEDLPGAIVPFQGRILVGVGKYLRVYELGKKKLLRKCENKVRKNSSSFVLFLKILTYSAQNLFDVYKNMQSSDKCMFCCLDLFSHFLVATSSCSVCVLCLMNDMT